MRKFSDTQLVNKTNQPGFGGLVKTDLFFETVYDDGVELAKGTSIPTDILFEAASSLSKFILTTNAKQSFRHAVYGAKIYSAKTTGNKAKYQEILNGLSLLNGLNKQSIYVAINLVQFSKFFLNTYRKTDLGNKFEPNENDYNFVARLVKRYIHFFKDHGPIGRVNFDFIDAKSEIISNANLDILSRTSLWDLSNCDGIPNEQERLLLLVHYVLFLHSPEAKYHSIRTIGIFSAFNNAAYTIQTSDISNSLLRQVEKILGFKDPEVTK